MSLAYSTSYSRIDDFGPFPPPALLGPLLGLGLGVLGVHSGDHTIYPDCRPEFYDALSAAFALGNWEAEKVSFELPYVNGDKKTILEDAMLSCDILDLDFDTIMGSTMTSYNPDGFGRSNGKTGSDIERILAFHDIGRIDPIEYAEPWEIVLENALRLRKKHGE